MAKSTNILKIAIAVPLHRIFDYLPPDSVDASLLNIGIRIRVPFAGRDKIGVLIEIVDQSQTPVEKLKQAHEILDTEPLLAPIDIELLQWMSAYYHHPLGNVLVNAMPTLLRKGKPAQIVAQKRYQLTESGTLVDPESLRRAPIQQSVVTQLQAHKLPVTTKQLSEWQKNWRPATTALISKELLEIIAEKQMAIAQTVATKTPALTANAQQQQVINSIAKHFGGFTAILLEGITGSGKTEVYMQLISQVIAQDKQVLILLPEISLTPQLEQRFKQRFSVAVEVSHSALSDLQRCSIWLKGQRGQSPIIIGTRSVLLMPMPRLGLIIIDEEHDSSFKQQKGLRFSARDVAIVRAKKSNIPILLGTATPSLASFYNVKTQRYQYLQLTERAGLASEPVLTLLDIRNKLLYEGLSDILLQQVKRVLDNQEQVLLFLNRRGYAPTLMCHSCGWIAQCRACDANLVVHYQDHALRCHHCGYQQNLLKQCPACKATELVSLGLGTERVETVLQEHFPKYNIVRLDRETTRKKGELKRRLQQINEGHADIILGTQMLAKGHHFPNVTLVGIIDIDSSLFSIDFHATEKMAQMIVQVSGRAGRSEKPGQVILQTRQPDHPLLQTLIQQGYRQFALQILQERQQANLPPYSYQALFRVLASDKQLALEFLQLLATFAQNQITSGIEIMGPVPAPMLRKAGQFRYQLLIQGNKRSHLHTLLDKLIIAIATLKSSSKVHWSLDVDPVDLY